MYENIKKAIAAYEAETLEKFTNEIKNKTAADILSSWYYKEYTTPTTLKEIQEAEQGEPLAAALLDKLIAKKARITVITPAKMPYFLSSSFVR